jgi:hypothetical protein
MTVGTLTHDDLEQMPIATLSTSPTPESERQTYAPAMWTLRAALADGRPATVAELAAAAGPRRGSL